MTYRQVRRSTVSNNLTDRITSQLRDDIVQRQIPARAAVSRRQGIERGLWRQHHRHSRGALASEVGWPRRLTSRQGGICRGRCQGTAVPARDDRGSEQFAAPHLRAAHGCRNAGRYAGGRTAQPSDLKAMLDCLKQMEPNKSPFEQALAADIAFHLSIARATQNPLIVSFMQFLATASV